MYVCVKQAYQNSGTNMKVFIPYDINLICPKYGTFTLICTIVPKGWCCPFSVLCLSDASLIIADNCNALCLIPPSAVRSVSTWLISYVNYEDTCCKVSNLSLFVTQFRSSVQILFISFIMQLITGRTLSLLVSH